MYSLTQHSLKAGQDVLAQRPMQSRKAYGPFLTPAMLGQCMAEQLGKMVNGDHILDPTMGSGTFTRRGETAEFAIEISSSASLQAIRQNHIAHTITRKQFIRPLGLFRLPTSAGDEEVLNIVDSWTGSFQAYGMAISTGPVVPFRARSYLMDKPDGTACVPLLWMQHIKPHKITWPLQHGFRKPQYIARALSLLVPNANYVLLRRFSAKEEVRRLVAAPYLARDYNVDLVGLENHLNYVYRPDEPLSPDEAIGLSALLNSSLLDRYFRIANGNTQVNATELRALPLPPLSIIQEIGSVLAQQKPLIWIRRSSKCFSPLDLFPWIEP
ncbi:MAG: hypothetical protein HC837_18250 [Chloroflexaceae bacterium]|nr:hypothetical protein [Chloroflexaceae bacterium]